MCSLILAWLSPKLVSCQPTFRNISATSSFPPCGEMEEGTKPVKRCDGNIEKHLKTPKPFKVSPRNCLPGQELQKELEPERKVREKLRLFEHSLHSHHSRHSQYVEMEPRKEMAMDPQPRRVMLALRPVQMEMRVALWQDQTEKQNWAQIFVQPDL